MKDLQIIQKWLEKQPPYLWQSIRNTDPTGRLDERCHTFYSTQQVFDKFIHDMAGTDGMFIGKQRFTHIANLSGYPVRVRSRMGKSVRCFVKL
jgi:hypothetical protein